MIEPLFLEITTGSQADLRQLDLAPGAPRVETILVVTKMLHTNPDAHARVLCAAPGDGIVAPASLCDGPLVLEPRSRRAAHAWRRRMEEVFGFDLDRAPKEDPWQRALLRLMEHLEQGRISFRFYEEELLRSKACIVYQERESRALISWGDLSIGKMNSTRELHSYRQGEEAAKVASWFESLWLDSVDFSPALYEILRQSWACGLLPPREAYHKALIEYFSDHITLEDFGFDENPMLEQLATFQQDAYHHALDILRRFGGVFISDVVGLGKTYVGLALLRSLVDNQDVYPLIIAPPRLCSMWEELANQYGVYRAHVLSNYQLEKLHRYEHCNVVLIDESHAFRNKDTERHKLLHSFLHPEEKLGMGNRQVILLSATPQNNTCWDVYHQLLFFPDTYRPLPYVGEDLRDFFKAVDRQEEQLSSLLQYILVRRTRRLIQAVYPAATLPIKDESGEIEERPIIFPKRRDGAEGALRYSIAEVYDELYEEILETLGGLTYARYGLAQYLRDEYRGTPKYMGLIRAGSSIRGLLKSTLLKRCESSLEAFKQSLTWLIGVHEAFYNALEMDGLVLTKPKHVGASIETMDLDDIYALFQASYDADDFDKAQLSRDIFDDWVSLGELQEKLAPVSARTDAKLQRLHQHLEDHDPRKHRTILFTQFGDTARYLYENIRDAGFNVALITGDHTNQAEIMRRFAPKAMGYQEEVQDPIDLLISTDVLAEGVNLQDADTIINYDLHWNPVRLIQRAGRIDRIGSENEEIYLFNFLPEAALEEELGLAEVVRRRAREIKDVFGADGQILSEKYEEHHIDEGEVIDIYMGRALDEVEEEEGRDELLSHRIAFMKLLQDEPQEYERLLNLRSGQRAMLHGGARTVLMGRAGWLRAFYEIKDEQIRELKPEQGLALLAKWADSTEFATRAAVVGAFNRAVQAGEERFERDADLLKRKRQSPRLTPAQDYLQEQLQRLERRTADEQKRRHIGTMIHWIRRGQFRAEFERYARRWRREKLAAEAIYQQMRGWLKRYPLDDEELGRAEVVISVLGP